MFKRIVTGATLLGVMALSFTPVVSAANHDSFNRQLTAEYSGTAELRADVASTIENFLERAVDLAEELVDARQEEDEDREDELEVELQAEFNTFYRDVVRLTAVAAAMAWGW